MRYAVFDLSLSCFSFRDLEDLFQDYERSVNEVAKKKNESGKLVVLHDKLVSEIQYKVNKWRA